MCSCNLGCSLPERTVDFCDIVTQVLGQADFAQEGFYARAESAQKQILYKYGKKQYNETEDNRKKNTENKKDNYGKGLEICQT